MSGQGLGSKVVRCRGGDIKYSGSRENNTRGWTRGSERVLNGGHRHSGHGHAVAEASPGCSVAGGPSGDQGGKESLWREVSEGHFIPRHGGCVHSQLLHNERTPDRVGVPTKVSVKARWQGARGR